MEAIKRVKDYLIKFISGSNFVPAGLSELHFYFRSFEGIEFSVEEQEDGTFVALSKNFHYGSIVTSAPTKEELIENVKDAILTAFDVPSSYATEANIMRTGDGYVFA